MADLDPARPLIGISGSGQRLAVVEWLSFVSTELAHDLSAPGCSGRRRLQPNRHGKPSRTKLATRFTELDALLSKKNYLAGEYSVADAYAFTVVNWTNFLAMPLTSYPHLNTYLARVAARPRVQQALKAEGLVK